MPIVGVSVKPGLMVLTRMLRGSSSEAKTLEKARIADFMPVPTLVATKPMPTATAVVKTNEPPSLTRGASRCAVKKAPLVLVSNIRS
ncbi:hypothetical protein SFUMM280S_07717 [Streptomyces fumanus]